MDSLPKNYKNLTQKEYRPLQHILTISALSLSPETKKLVQAMTTTILTHIWKTDDYNSMTLSYPQQTIINIKNYLKNIIQTDYKQHAINNTLDEFKTIHSVH